MSVENTIKRYSLAEEIFNSITHGVGTLLSLAGLVVLIVLVWPGGSARSLTSFGIYGATLVILYLASTLYHSIPSPQIKRVLRILDHSSIYLLIAGSYTPVTLLALRGMWGWSLFAIVWALALAGIVLNMISLEKTRKASIILYVLMGWLVVVATRPLLAVALPGLLICLLAGGLFYTTGILFYASKRIPFHHGIWHIFVLAGSICHFLGFALFLA